MAWTRHSKPTDARQPGRLRPPPDRAARPTVALTSLYTLDIPSWTPPHPTSPRRRRRPPMSAETAHRRARRQLDVDQLCSRQPASEHRLDAVNAIATSPGPVPGHPRAHSNRFGIKPGTRTGFGTGPPRKRPAKPRVGPSPCKISFRLSSYYKYAPGRGRHYIKAPYAIVTLKLN